MTSPRRGEVWLVDLGMAAKVRPALVVSIPAEDTDRALVTLVPHTTSPRQSRFEAAVSVPFLRAGVIRCAEPCHDSPRQVGSATRKTRERSTGGGRTSRLLVVGVACENLRGL